ncbi:MAG TPA: VOC family protein [Terracidiphilus sp.]|jgi:predicted 3-demethylubiquinone-9 3-methyltransferase (glyoxalase superfamily)
MNKITPFLWFDANAEDAAQFYFSVFKNSRKLNELRVTEAGPGPKGSLLAMDLELDGQQVTFLNGGPAHQLSEAFSFTVRCETQAEIDGYWSKLGDGGTELGCGWLKDKFGLCWQIVPARLYETLRHPAAMRAMMAMKKFDIATLEQAAS